MLRHSDFMKKLDKILFVLWILMDFLASYFYELKSNLIRYLFFGIGIILTLYIFKRGVWESGILEEKWLGNFLVLILFMASFGILGMGLVSFLKYGYYPGHIIILIIGLIGLTICYFGIRKRKILGK
ncbi:MAG: hypothetical protein AABW56_04300 [Nanoarchaeota archaeon]